MFEYFKILTIGLLVVLGFYFLFGIPFDQGGIPEIKAYSATTQTVIYSNSTPTVSSVNLNAGINITVIITEGFGQIAMADRTFNLLKQREGSIASISGRTQIRAGVMRPEIIIPVREAEAVRERSTRSISETGMEVGNEVRIIREPYFGRLGQVKSLPPKLQKIETEAKVRVMEVVLKTGETVVVPRANVEIIEV